LLLVLHLLSSPGKVGASSIRKPTSTEAPLQSVPSHLLYFSRAVPTTILNYVGDGSSAGIANIIANNVDFAGSDATLSAAQYVVFVLLFFFPPYVKTLRACFTNLDNS